MLIEPGAVEGTQRLKPRIAILPTAENAATPADDLREITITHPPMRARLALAWKADTPVAPATTALIQHITQSIGSEAIS